MAEVGAGFSLRWTEPDYGCSCKHYDKLVRLSDAEAIIAQKDAEILEQCRINGMGAEREAALLGKVAQQSAALKRARDALGKLSLYVAYNGDDWVKRNATDALAAIDEVLKGE